MRRWTPEEDAELVEGLRAGLQGRVIAARYTTKRKGLRGREEVLVRLRWLRRKHGLRAPGAAATRYLAVPRDLAEWVRQQAAAAQVDPELMLAGIIKDAMHESA